MIFKTYLLLANRNSVDDKSFQVSVFHHKRRWNPNLARKHDWRLSLCLQFYSCAKPSHNGSCIIRVFHTTHSHVRGQ